MNTRKIEITEKGTREYYKELVNITSQYRSLIKKPDMKLRNNFNLYKSYIIICAAFLIALSLMAVFWGADTICAEYKSDSNRIHYIFQTYPSP